MPRWVAVALRAGARARSLSPTVKLLGDQRLARPSVSAGRRGRSAGRGVPRCGTFQDAFDQIARHRGAGLVWECLRWLIRLIRPGQLGVGAHHGAEEDRRVPQHRDWRRCVGSDRGTAVPETLLPVAADEVSRRLGSQLRRCPPNLASPQLSSAPPKGKTAGHTRSRHGDSNPEPPDYKGERSGSRHRGP
jgi:hypothetical protein